jgi:hypothetical protein
MEKPEIEIKQVKEKYSNFSDFQDYKSKKSVDKFFTIKGFIKSISIVLLFFIVCVTFARLIEELDIWVKIKLTPSFIILVIGIGIYFFSRSLKKNTNLLIKKTPEQIKLSSPFYFDLISFFSGLVVFMGIVLVLVSLALLYENYTLFYFGGMGAVYLIVYCFILYNRYRHSIFDKIVIFRDYILFDHPESKETIRINKKEISKIVDLRLLTSGSLDKRIIEFHFINQPDEKIVEIEDNHLENMRLNLDLFIVALNEMDYSLKIELFSFGQTNRTDENGNQLMD